MLRLARMIKELGGTVSIRFHEGIYDASCDGVLHYGMTPEGAVWNVLNQKRRARNRAAPTEAREYRVSRFYQVIVGEIPSAGQG
jgi:hypothetical protein